MIAGRRVIAFDGKTLRGARDAAGNLVHLLAGLCQATGTVLAQLAIGAKTNEIPMLRTLLDTIDITDAVITA
ncbi:MAG TPA: ISAs1 family transposase, partial [Mycobacterium sp.]|nr:ISAs1 family transposase [Mycobacterium sp.]